MILAANPGTPEPELSERLRLAIIVVAIQDEILDEREALYYLGIDVQRDLDRLRQRAIDLADAPKLRESIPFAMDREDISYYLQLNRDYRKYLSTRYDFEVDRRDILGIAIEETNQLCRVWEKLSASKASYSNIEYRRQALRELRNLIGIENFRLGIMPDSVPYWQLP